MKKLSELYEVESDVLIKGIKINSKEIEEGDLFICVSGFSADRHDFIDEAIERGASAIVVSKDIKKDIPKKFDLLLIQGMPHVVMNLYGANINKLFGDVIEESDTNYKSLYEAIFKLISTSSTHDYELCHDKVSELGKELYLIKRRK